MKVFLNIFFVANAFISPFNTQTMHIKPFYTQQPCYVLPKTLYPGRIRTWVFSFLRQKQCPLCHAARAWLCRYTSISWTKLWEVQVHLEKRLLLPSFPCYLSIVSNAPPILEHMAALVSIHSEGFSQLRKFSGCCFTLYAGRGWTMSVLDEWFQILGGSAFWKKKNFSAVNVNDMNVFFPLEVWDGDEMQKPFVMLPLVSTKSDDRSLERNVS
jgi:hypothetical protein